MSVWKEGGLKRGSQKIEGEDEWTQGPLPAPDTSEGRNCHNSHGIGLGINLGIGAQGHSGLTSMGQNPAGIFFLGGGAERREIQRGLN